MAASNKPEITAPEWDLTQLFPGSKDAAGIFELRERILQCVEEKSSAFNASLVVLADALKKEDIEGIVGFFDQSDKLIYQLKNIEEFARLSLSANPNQEALVALSNEVSELIEKTTSMFAENTRSEIARIPPATRNAWLEKFPDLENHALAAMPSSSDELENLQREARHAYDLAHAMNGPERESAQGKQAFALALNTKLDSDAQTANKQGFASPLEDFAHHEKLPLPFIEAWRALRPALSSLRQESFAMEKRVPVRHALLSAAKINKQLKLYSWEEARALVTEAIAGFDPSLAPILERAFHEKWIDAKNNPDKTGAFTSPGRPSSLWPEAHPYICMRYRGTGEDVLTLAHELAGHCVAAVLAGSKHKTGFHASTTLQETFALFAERLVMEKMKEKASSPMEKVQIAISKNQENMGELCRPAAIIYLQQELYAAHHAGKVLSYDDITALNAKAHEGFLRPDLEEKDKQTAHESWRDISHLFTSRPYYQMTYSLANMAAGELFRQWKAASPEGKERFAEAWSGVMEAGRSINYAQALGRMGIDIGSPAFFSQGIANAREDLKHTETELSKLPVLATIRTMSLSQLYSMASGLVLNRIIKPCEKHMRRWFPAADPQQNTAVNVQDNSPLPSPTMRKQEDAIGKPTPQFVKAIVEKGATPVAERPYLQMQQSAMRSL